tara:strand:+ start:215 stop:400 length:186 start_codon:yes stop_codon:yes gene_type:complete
MLIDKAHYYLLEVKVKEEELGAVLDALGSLSLSYNSNERGKEARVTEVLYERTIGSKLELL